MIIDDSTRYYLAYSLDELSRKKPISQITVVDIVNNCKTSRRTFYNNFKDKNDLISWIYHESTRPYIMKIGDQYSWQDAIIDIYKMVLKKRYFYLEACKDTKKNGLTDFAYNCYVNDCMYIIGKKHPQVTLNEETIFAIELYFHGVIDMTLAWIIDNSKITPEEISKSLIKSMPQMVSDVLIN